MSIVAWIVLGLLAGWIAGMLMGGGFGLLGDIVIGILGAIVGGWITATFMGGDAVTGFNLQSLLVAVLGAIVLIAISRVLFGRARV